MKYLLLIFLFFPVLVQAAIVDSDQDGISDKDEVAIYKTDPKNSDSDDDGYLDGEEIRKGYDPLLANKKKLQKRIIINIKNQELEYYLGHIKLGSYKVSTGKRSTPTPKGEFKIINKAKRAWSKTYGLWMPYWMGLDRGRIGIHELPEWPNGYKEGVKHIGIPVSHGCIRLAVGPAKQLYEWASTGTKVIIN